MVDRANAAHRELRSSEVTFVRQPEHAITFGHGGSTRRLERVVPEFSAGLPPDPCVEFTASVLGDSPGLVIFRPAGPGVPAVSPVNAEDSFEVTGMQRLAQAMAAAVDTVAPGVAPDLSGVDPAWAAAATNQDRRAMGDVGRPAALAGQQYGSALNLAPGNASRRERMDEVERRIGVNKHAWAGIGEVYCTSSIPAEAADGSAALTSYAHDRPISPHPWGYSFAVVVAESEDGQAQVALKNYTHWPELGRKVREAVEQNLRRYAGRFAELRERLAQQAAAGTDARATLRVELADAGGCGWE